MKRFLILLASVCLLLVGCSNSKTLPTAQLIRLDSSLCSIQFTIKETSLAGDRHNPFDLDIRKKLRSFWIVVPDSLGKFGMGQTEVEFKRPRFSHQMDLKENPGSIEVGKDFVVLKMENPTSDYNGRFRLIRDPVKERNIGYELLEKVQEEQGDTVYVLAYGAVTEDFEGDFRKAMQPIPNWKLIAIDKKATAIWKELNPQGEWLFEIRYYGKNYLRSNEFMEAAAMTEGMKKSGLLWE